MKKRLGILLFQISGREGKCISRPEYAELWHTLNDVAVECADDFAGWESEARRPYYRIRGKKVTPEQAFEVIRRTDRFMGQELKFGSVADYVDCCHFQNDWFCENSAPMGWMQPDGTVGGEGLTQKYPDACELLMELHGLAAAFPFLDMVFAISDSDEECPEPFEEHIEIVFSLQGGGVAVWEGAEARAKYEEYDALYNKERHGGAQTARLCGREYLRRCITASGQDAETLLKDVPWYVLKKEM